MFGSPVLGTAVGLVLLFATTALLCSAITEALSNILQMRAKYLLTGMRAMLDASDRNTREAAGVVAGTRAALSALRGPRDPDPSGPAAPGGDPAAVAAAPPASPAAATPPPTPAATPPPTPAGASAPVVDGGRGSALVQVQTAAGKRPKTELHERVKNPAETRWADAVVQDRIAKPEPVAGPLDLTTALWNNPLLASLQSRRVGAWWSGTVRNPQYVSGRAFARALVDLLVPDTPDGTPPLVLTIEQIRQAVEQLPPSQPVRRPLLVFLAQAGDDVTAFERAVEQWYDEQMAKITGWYKRWAKVVLGVVGFLVAVAANIDTVQVTEALYVDAPLQQSVLATANTGTLCQDVGAPAERSACVRTELQNLQADGVPLGWATPPWSDGTTWPWRSVLLKLLGWGLTAFAVSFGAPFWFEALSKLGSLRNAGTRPADTPRSA
jgi:hypothetical protein